MSVYYPNKEALKLIEINEAYNQIFIRSLCLCSSCSCKLSAESGANYCLVLPPKINNSYSTDNTMVKIFAYTSGFGYFPQPPPIYKLINIGRNKEI